MAKAGLKKQEKKKEAKARKRAEVIMKVRCGLITASRAAKILGVSRKTYYKWEQRGLSALLTGLEDQPAGRPEQSEESRQEVEYERRLAEMQREKALLKQKIELKDLLAGMKREPTSSRTKKK